MTQCKPRALSAGAGTFDSLLGTPVPPLPCLPGPWRPYNRLRLMALLLSSAFRQDWPKQEPGRIWGGRTMQLAFVPHLMGPPKEYSPGPTLVKASCPSVCALSMPSTAGVLPSPAHCSSLFSPVNLPVFSCVSFFLILRQSGS